MIRFDRASKRYLNGREALTAASFEIGDGKRTRSPPAET